MPNSQMLYIPFFPDEHNPPEAVSLFEGPHLVFEHNMHNYADDAHAYRWLDFALKEMHPSHFLSTTRYILETTSKLLPSVVLHAPVCGQMPQDQRGVVVPRIPPILLTNMPG